jgi:8-oxo-dGTP diphosphatase
MISQAVIIQDHHVLMVKQFVQRGDIVWNFPGGGMEQDETPEQACIREVKEETGYEVRINKLLFHNREKYSFLAEIIGGNLMLNKELAGNEDLVEVKWISLLDSLKFDRYTTPIIDIYYREVD